MIEAGSVIVNPDGTASVSGLAGYIYESRIDGFEADYNVSMSKLPDRQVPLKKSIASVSNHHANAIVSYLLDNVFTPEGGYTVKLVNKTGLPSVKGSIVQASTAQDGAFQLQSSRLEAIGIVYDNGIDDDSLCRVVVAGIADVLLENGIGVAHGDWVGCALTKGRAYHDPVFPPPEHFREIGHCIQSATAGTDVLVKAVIHFN